MDLIFKIATRLKKIELLNIFWERSIFIGANDIYQQGEGIICIRLPNFLRNEEGRKIINIFNRLPSPGITTYSSFIFKELELIQQYKNNPDKFNVIINLLATYNKEEPELVCSSNHIIYGVKTSTNYKANIMLANVLELIHEQIIISPKNNSELYLQNSIFSTKLQDFLTSLEFEL